MRHLYANSNLGQCTRWTRLHKPKLMGSVLGAEKWSVNFLYKLFDECHLDVS